MLGRGLLPQGEIVWGALVARTVQAACIGLHLIDVAAGKHSVMIFAVISWHIEVHGTVALVGKTRVHNPPDEFYLFNNMPRSPGLYARRQCIQPAHGIVIGNGVGLHHLHGLERFETRLLCYLVITFVRIMLQVSHISYIPDIAHLVTQIPEKAHKHVICHSRPGMPQMRLAIYCRTADIETDHARMYRDEYFLPP